MTKSGFMDASIPYIVIVLGGGKGEKTHELANLVVSFL